MKLFLMLRGHADLDEDNAVVVDPDIDSGMRAAARLLADWLADALDGAGVQAPAGGGGGSSDSESTPPAATPAPSPAPETTDGQPGHRLAAGAAAGSALSGRRGGAAACRPDTGNQEPTQISRSRGES